MDERTTHVTPRWEFRIWATGPGDLDMAVAHMRALASDRRSVRSSEVYLICRDRPGLNAKIRDGVVDVKELIGLLDEFEQWAPVLKLQLPVTPDDLNATFFRLMDWHPHQLDAAKYGPAEVVDLLAADPATWLVATVEKTREIFTLAGAIGEVVEVAVAGQTLIALAIEAEQVGVVGELREALGVVDLENTSYPVALARALEHGR